MVFHSAGSRAISKQQTQSVQSQFEKIVIVRSKDSAVTSKQSFSDGDDYIHMLTKNGRMYLCHAPKTTKLRVVYNLLDDLDLELAKLPRLINANKGDVMQIIKDLTVGILMCRVVIFCCLDSL